MGGSAYEETLEMAVVLVRGSRGVGSTGKAVMRLSREKDPSTGGHQALVGWFWLISFPSFWKECGYLAPLPPLYLYAFHTVLMHFHSPGGRSP